MSYNGIAAHALTKMVVCLLSAPPVRIADIQPPRSNQPHIDFHSVSHTSQAKGLFTPDASLLQQHDATCHKTSHNDSANRACGLSNCICINTVFALKLSKRRFPLDVAIDNLLVIGALTNGTS